MNLFNVQKITFKYFLQDFKVKIKCEICEKNKVFYYQSNSVTTDSWHPQI